MVNSGFTRTVRLCDLVGSTTRRTCVDDIYTQINMSQKFGYYQHMFKITVAQVNRLSTV